MITLLQDLPENVIGFVASGHVSASDYEAILIPTIKAALDQHGKVRILYQLADDFDGFTLGGMWDDTKVGLGHLASWEKIAVVTDTSWVAHAVGMFRFVMPCPIQVFGLNELSQAKVWAAA